MSRFENNEKNIQLSSALNILDMLGLVDERQSNFPDKEAHYLPDRMVVMFYGKVNDKDIKCAISWEALCDHYNGDGKNSLEVFKANRFSIEQEVRRKYLADKLENDGSILIRTIDLDY